MKKISTLLAILAMAIIAPLSANANWGSYKIMLDPGHGGSDPGAAGPRAPHEAALALRCANSIVSWLKTNGCPYRMTRTSDVYVTLSARRAASVSYDPYLFCSIHLNAFNGSAHGTETWYYWSGGNSHALANKVQATLVQQLGRTNRGVKQNGWTVITGSSNVPAILTEALFVDNSTEWGMINETSKSGFKAWVNGHLYGFYDFGTGVQGKNLTPNPRSGGGTTTPDPTPSNPTLTVSTTSLHFTCSVGEKPTLSFTVKGSNLSSDISVASRTPGRFATSVTSLPKTGGTVTVTFANADKVGTYGEGGTANNYKFLVAVTNGSLRKEVIITAEVKAPPLSLSEGWNLSEKKNSKASKGYDASLIRNFCYNDGKLYCVYNHSDIKVIDAQTGKDLGNLKKGEVVTGGTLTLCDVKALDGHIIACNLAASGQKLRIYEWANDNALPTLVMETDNFQNASRLGDCIELIGKYPSDYWIDFANENNKQTRIIEYHMKDNKCVEAKNTPVYREDKSTNLSTMATVRAYPLNGNWWIDGKDSYPTYVIQENGKAYRKTFVDTGESWGSSHHEFYWGGQKYSANLVFNGKEYNADGSMKNEVNYKGARMRLVQDLTGDFKRMQQVGDFPSNGLGDTSRNTNATGDIIVRTDGTNWLEAWVLSTTHGMAYYKHGTPPKTEGQPVQSAEPMISVDKTSLNFSAKQGQTAVQELTASGANLKGVINMTLSGANADMFSLSAPSLSTPGKFKVSYTPKAEGKHTATLTLSTQGAANVTVALTGTGEATIVVKEDIASNTDKLKAEWIYSTNKNNTPSWTTFDATQSANRDIALIGSKLYVLNSKNWGTPSVNILNAEDASYKGTLSVADLASATGKLGGLAVADGKLIASNIVTAAQNLRVYIWDNDAAAPRVLVQKDAAGIITGGSVAFSGTLNDGRVWLTKEGANEVVYFEIKNGTCDNNMHTIALKNAKGEAFTYGADGRGASKIYPNADGSFWMVQKDSQIAKFDASGKITDEVLPAEALGGSRYGTAFAPFNVGNKKYIAAITYKTGNIGNGQIAIIDVTDGVAKAKAPIINLPEEGFGSVNNAQFASTVIASAGGNLNGNISIYANVHNQGIGRFFYQGEVKDAISDIINIEDASADAEYYNLQGVRVAADNLTTGVYIRRQGNKAEKVYVK